MRILVCGGRNYGYKLIETIAGQKTQGTDAEAIEFLYTSLDQLHLNPLFDLIIEGGATGADYWASQWANEYDVPCLRVPAPWRRDGKSAGPMRNLRMLEYRPELLVAFPGGRGTAHMIKIAQEAGVALWQPQLHAELPSPLIDQLRIRQDKV